MAWFTANIIVSCRLKQGLQTSIPVYENLTLFEADSFDDAFAKAEKYAQRYVSTYNTDETLHLNGKPAHWNLEGIRNIVQVTDMLNFDDDLELDQIRSGVELYYIWAELADQEALQRLATGKTVDICYLEDDDEEEEPAPLRWFTQAPDVKGSAVPYGNNPAVGQYVQADDARIYYESYGSGSPLFVFHGGGVGSPYELGQMLDELQKRFRVIVVSTRGHGRSEIGTRPLTFEQKANDMLAVMRTVTEKPAPVLGFSDGAYTAYKLATMYPEAVERIVAIGAGTLEPGFFPSAMRVEDIEKIDKAFVDQQRRLMPEPERLQEFWTAYMVFWSQMRVGEEVFGAIRCPVLLIAGDEDDHAPIVSVVAAHQMIPNSRLCIVPKAWHTTFLDNFPLTWAAVEPFFLAELDTLQPAKKLEQNTVK